MKKILITTICLMFVVLGYAQEIDKRYEYCAFRVAHGHSSGALTTDFVVSKEHMTEALKEAGRNALFSKDIIFDVQFHTGDDGAIMRVFHLSEVSSDDLKVLFAQVAGNLDYVIRPSRTYKFNTTSED